MFKLIKLFSVFFVITNCLFAFSSNAQQIKSLRAYHNTQKSRVVIDLKDNPNYSYSLSKSGDVFIIRIRNVDNSSSAPSKVDISPVSCVKSLAKKNNNSDVRYIFTIKDCKVARPFTLAPAKGTAYRLVLDYIHNEKASAAVAKSNKNQNSNDIKKVNSSQNDKIDTAIPLKEYERKLFIEYSTVSKDGIRSMNAKNAVIYNQKINALRNDYELAANQKNKSKKETVAKVDDSKKKKNADVEEEVKETIAPPVPVKATPISRPFVISVDAGHGGKDPGAIGKRGVKEKNVTLAISKALVNYINSNPKFRGNLVRSRDIFIDLDKRSDIARKRKADLLISIHADSVESGSSTARGASVLVLSENRAQRENGKLLKNKKDSKKLIGGAGEVMDQSVGNPYLATAILDMSSTNSRSEGNLLAKEILSSLAKFTHVRKTSPIKASLAVLKAPDIPSLLIETGYLSNRYEEIQLNQPNYQKQIAYRIYLGIKSYYEKYPAQKIKSRVESYTRNQKLSGYKSVTVKKGDSLSLIAKRNKTTVSEIKRINSLKSDSLKIGQVLYIP